MNSRMLAPVVVTGLFLGIVTCIGSTSHTRAEVSSSEVQKERKAMKRQHAKENKPSRREEAQESRARNEKKDEINSRGLEGMGRGPVERRPGGCPEGPPCKGLP